MNILIDTGVLLRLTIPRDPGHADARQAIRILKAGGDKLIATTQNAAEFWNVCTRPAAARGGYGLSIDETARKLRLIERLIEIKPDSLPAFQEWKRIVITHSVQGAQVHDARLVAAMTAFGITHVLTFNCDDLRRFPGITVLSPVDVK
ncbi:MAG: type II toxin-antitoxin system VapC family toxin [Acidobacteria bacterium]|nr:type II toxin-antitoxin system VapC family toxin [Acidobacteriota bacterium]MCI0717653.1 type II toxin-antitoxin system VapC family toxin [Acidobacteriota bacterium]